MKLYCIIFVLLLLPELSFGDDVCVHLNGGTDEVYIGQWNTLEIWIQNDYSLSAMIISLGISWDPSVTITWNMTYGNHPPVQSHGRALDAFDLMLLAEHDFDNVSSDHISLSGVALAYALPAGPSALCYSLQFMATAPAGVSGGFCVQPFDYHSTPIQDWVFNDISVHSPDFCGYPVSDMDVPYAPPACFDVAPPALGDCDNNGVGGAIADFVYLTSYLFDDGPPPPDPNACDCDNYPGVNFGDIWQLAKHVENPTVYPLYGSLGADYMMPIPLVKFLVVGDPDGVSVTSAAIMSKEFTSGTSDVIECMLLVLSYAAGPGEADLNCTGIDFTGSAASNLTANFDNTTKTLWIWNNQTPVMDTWDHWGLIATAHFVPDPSGSSGDGVRLRSSVLAAKRPIVLSRAAFAASDGLGARVSFASFAGVDFSAIEYVGDADCSGGVDIDDVVYLINYIFGGGPPPGDTDNDGVPDC